MLLYIFLVKHILQVLIVQLFELDKFDKYNATPTQSKPIIHKKQDSPNKNLKQSNEKLNSKSPNNKPITITKKHKKQIDEAMNFAQQ